MKMCVIMVHAEMSDTGRDTAIMHACAFKCTECHVFYEMKGQHMIRGVRSL